MQNAQNSALRKPYARSIIRHNSKLKIEKMGKARREEKTKE
jgi:hypothetical protein